MSERPEVVLFQPRIGYMDELRSKPALPLSLLYAARELVQDFDVRILDQRVSRDWAADLRRAVARRPLFVGLTAWTGPMIDHALEAAAVARQTAPEVPLVWGGPHPTLAPEQTLAHALVDVVVLGPGERPALELARRRAAGEPLTGIPGSGVATAQGPVVTPPLRTAPSLAPPPFHLVEVERYIPLYQGRRTLSLQASRGCPHACAYCYNTAVEPRGWQPEDVDAVLAQIRGLVRDHGIEDLYFVDDNFFVDARRARRLVEGLYKLDCVWQVQGADQPSLDRLGDDDLALLRDSGCHRLSIGIEAASDRMRRRLNKPGSAEDVLRTVARLAPYGFVIFGSFMTNLPGETRTDLAATVALIDRLHQANPNFRNSPIYTYTPFPGTALYAEAVADGFVPPRSLEDWAQLSYEHRTYAPPGAPPRGFHEGLYLCSLLNDEKIEDYSDSAALRLLARVYRPVARYRLQRLFFSLMPEVAAIRRWL